MNELSANEKDHVLARAASEQEEDDSQLAVAVSDMQEQVQEQVLKEEELDVSTGNQRPVLGALSTEQPVHTSPAQTCVSQPAGKRKRKKKADPDFLYQ